MCGLVTVRRHDITQQTTQQKMKTQKNYWLFIVSILLTTLLFTGCGKPKVSKEEWKAKLSQNNQMFGVTGGVLQMKKADFVKLMGSPDKTQTEGDQVYWYYECKDGEIQLVLAASALSGGVLAGRANDY